MFDGLGRSGWEFGGIVGRWLYIRRISTVGWSPVKEIEAGGWAIVMEISMFAIPASELLGR